MFRPFARTEISLLFFALLPAAAHAQAFRAYLASYGNDANAGCTVSAPCRLLPAALNAIVSGGEVWMLDSANFNAGTVTITKSVNILAVPGQVGSLVSVANSAAIVINPGLVVSLRNVSITNNASNPGTDGIIMTTGSLSVEDSILAVAGNAIHVSGTGTLSVHNSLFRGGNVGVYIDAGGTADVSSSKFYDNQFPAYADARAASTTSYINVRDCSISRAHNAITAVGNVPGAASRVVVHNTTVSSSQYGLISEVNVAGASTYLGISNSTVSGSAQYGVFQSGSGAVLESLGNNLVRANAANSGGTITIVAGS
jgi:hypothetical protein